MTIPRNDQLKKAIVSKLKTKANILAELDDVNEIREAQWQGDGFTYPNIRVRILPDGNKPNQENCNYANIRVGIAVFSEDASSQQADRISGIIGNELHTQSFTSEGIKFPQLIVESIIPAVRMEERTWMSELILIGTANG
jgi:hypothetical protein